MNIKPLRTIALMAATFPGVFRAVNCVAELGKVLVLVQDTGRRPVQGVEIGIEGPGGSKMTLDDGKVQLPVGPATKEGDWLSLVILHSPAGKDLVMISPWDNRAQVPSFEDKPENFIRVVVLQRGDRAALEDSSIITSLASKIFKANAPKLVHSGIEPVDLTASLAAVAKEYGLKPEEVDQAVRALSRTATDPYQVGMAALYERNFPAATSKLQDSVRQREEKLKTDMTAVAQDKNEIADRSLFLGFSLYQQGKYRDAAEALEKSLEYRADDPVALKLAAASLGEAGDITRAEPLARRVLEIDEEAVRGMDNPRVADDLGILATLLLDKGDYAEAETLLRQALAIDEMILGPDYPETAIDLGNLATVLMDQGDNAEAEPLLRRALEIDKKNLNPGDPKLAVAMNNLGSVLRKQHDLSGAEALLRSAVAIQEKAPGPENPMLARYLNNLGLLLIDKGDYDAAESPLRRAIAIDEKMLGPEHPDVSIGLDNLANMYRGKHDYAAAEPLLRRAFAINEKALGPGHPSVALSLNNLARLLQYQERYAEAEGLFRKALAIDVKALGSENPRTKHIQSNLNAVLEAEQHVEK